MGGDAMGWTQDVPTENGEWYWLAYKDEGDWVLEVVQVERRPDGWCVCRGPYDYEYFDGADTGGWWWLGPITEPDPPSAPL